MNRILIFCLLINKLLYSQVFTGSYVGDGNSNRLVTTPFQPDVVIVKAGNALQYAYIKTVDMSSTVSHGMVTPTNGTTQITGLSASGFTIGNSNAVNNSGKTYHYVAMQNTAGKIKTGSYIGDGISGRSVLGVGFQPEYIIVIPSSSSNRVVFRHIDMINTLDFGQSPYSSNRILSFIADGFTVGTDNSVNQSGTTYFYVCFNRTAEISINTYTGNNVDDRCIITNNDPDYVIVRGDNNNYACQRMESMGTDISVGFDNASTSQETSNLIQSSLVNGFVVGNHNRVNDGSTTVQYFYIAFDFSQYTSTSNCPPPLPVTFLGLNLTPLKGGINVEWSTASEINNDYFTVERSKDGFYFSDIQHVKGAGYSNKHLNYSFKDLTPENGILYYRIKQTDFDGNYDYSEVKAIKYGDSFISIYPNPNSGKEIKFKLEENIENIYALITNSYGEIVFDSIVSVDNKNGEMFILFDDPIKSGVYNVQVLYDGYYFFGRFIVN